MSGALEERRSRSRTLNVIVPVIGLLYPDLFIIVLSVQSFLTTGSVPDFVIFFIPILITFALLAAGIWRRFRVAYLVSAAFTGFFLIFSFVVNWDHGIGVFSDPEGTVEFTFVVTSLAGLVGAFAYSVLGLRELGLRRKQVKGDTPLRTIPRSSIIGLLLLGFVVGGLIVGSFAGATISRVISNSGIQADITVVQGAGASTNGQFYVPQSFTVKVGTSVNWVNRDTTPHTVTSTTGAFDSGSLASGAPYKFTFTQAGTYPYICSFHSWMKGTVTVVSG